MACPCFYPVERIPQTGRSTPAPLGDLWSGICRARPESEWSPDAATAEQFCNFGYAQGKCPRFAGDRGDAVRFAVSQDYGEGIRIYWVVEKDHLPFAHGLLEYSRADAGFQTAQVDALVARQAQAYIGSYLRRKEGAGKP